MKIDFFIYGECRGKMRPKASYFGGHARVYTPAPQIEYENWVRLCYQKALEGLKTPFQGFGEEPVAIYVDIVKAVPKSVSKKKRQMMLNGEIKNTTKPDIDNACKSLLDGLNNLAIKDDSQVALLFAKKRYGEQSFVHMIITDEFSDKMGIDPFDDRLTFEEEPL